MVLGLSTEYLFSLGVYAKVIRVKHYNIYNFQFELEENYLCREAGIKLIWQNILQIKIFFQ